MKEFLETVTAREALRIITRFPLDRGEGTVDIEDASGRVLAREVKARGPIPPFARSLVDGYAVRARDTLGARESNPLPLLYQGEIRVAEEATVQLSAGRCIYVSTGAMIPAGADAVVMQEQTRRTADIVEFTRTVRVAENVIAAGEDMQAGRKVLAKGRRLTPQDCGALAALGAWQVPVYDKPRVAVISSGDEIVPVRALPGPGKVRDINRYTVTAELTKAGAEPRFIGLASDNPTHLSELFLASQSFDLILISGGSSKGERDFIASAIANAGGKVLFHGISIRPGKPTLFGRLFNRPIFGLPGHPISCLMVTRRFVLPLVRRMCGETGAAAITVGATLATNVPSTLGVEEYVPVSLERTGKGLAAHPVFTKSSAISSLVKASGYIIVPEAREGLEEGEGVEVEGLD